MLYAIQKGWELLLSITALMRFFGTAGVKILSARQRNSKLPRDTQMQAVHA